MREISRDLYEPVLGEVVSVCCGVMKPRSVGRKGYLRESYEQRFIKSIRMSRVYLFRGTKRT
jgi:hypothetical protein